MHILFLTDNFPPEVNAPASRTFEHCREWVAAGHRVTVITCAPNAPKGKVYDGYRNRLWQSEEINGIRVIRVWSYITSNEGFAKRILDYLSYMFTSFFAAFFVRRVDIIVGTSPQFFTACSAYMVSIFKWKPWVFELRDIWPESIRAVGAMEQSRVLDFLEKVELFLYRRASVIVTVTRAFKENLRERGIDGDKIHVVTNGVDTGRFAVMPKDPDIVARLELEGKFVVGYIGTHGMAHALDTILDAAKRLGQDPNGQSVKFLMLGDGAEKAALQEKARRDNLQNIIFLGSVSKDQVTRYWSVLDASVIHLKGTDLFKTVIPSKMFECMAMGIPILHGVRGESAEIVEKYNVGLTFQPENEQALIGCIDCLKADPAMLKQIKDNGPAAAKHFDRTILAQEMLAILSGTIASADSQK